MPFPSPDPRLPQIPQAPMTVANSPQASLEVEAASPLLGQMLITRGVIGPSDLERALDLQAGMGGRLGSLLVRIGALSEEQLLAALSDQLALPLAGRDVILPEAEAWVVPGDEAVSVDWMQDQEVLIWQDAEGAIWCASRDPLDPTVQEMLAYLYPGQPVQRVLAATQLMESTLDRLGRGLLASALANSLPVAVLSCTPLIRLPALTSWSIVVP